MSVAASFGADRLAVLDFLERAVAAGLHVELGERGEVRFRTDCGPAPEPLLVEISVRREALVELLRAQRESA